jgi:adenylate kinase
MFTSHVILLSLQVPDSAIVERITGRRLDPETGKIYHMTYKKPEDETIAKRLITRSDDTVDKVGQAA